MPTITLPAKTVAWIVIYRKTKIIPKKYQERHPPATISCPQNGDCDVKCASGACGVSVLAMPEAAAGRRGVAGGE